ncbi:MFS transporter [Arthrobacter sp. ISL-65]|uniref:MFS transporter n=1 Tax=Arthrobacter sp. ISL-65 TaxID=2819112 RepID=UPI001BE59C13|nr:MFS transporter [Arthrobacter sp. ISL-65]MBT2548942.1 hypothetical protein [Arthrobacter sp. ISL-65]
MTTTLATHGMTRLRTIVFAIAAGLAVGNLYWAQPLIEEIARSLDVSSAAAASLVTVTQIGYALGIFLIVPLGDVLNRKRMIPLILGLSAIALLGAAVAPTFSLLLAALGGVGLTTVSRSYWSHWPVNWQHPNSAGVCSAPSPPEPSSVCSCPALSAVP